MATKMKIEKVGTEMVWTERVSGRRVFAFDTSTVADSLTSRVLDYGLKQIVADAAAGAKTEREAVAAMTARVEALQTGTWGQRATRLPDADVFTALVAVGKLPDSDAARVKWAALKPSERRALGRLPDVVTWLATYAEDVGATEDVLAMFKA